MSHQEQKPSAILKYLPMIVVLVGLVGSYVTLQNQQASANSRLDKIEDRQSKIDSDNTQILVQLSQIQNDIAWIKLKLK